MSKTAHPHPASYLTFGCLVTETVEYLDALLPWSLPPEEWAQIADEFPTSFARHHARQHELLRSELVEQECGALMRLGLPADRLSEVATREYVALQVSTKLFLTLECDKRQPVLELRFDEDGNYAPRRETVRKIIVGEHFAHGGGNRAQTARSLNAGMPTRDRCYGVTDSNVRDALNSLLGATPETSTAGASCSRARSARRRS